jgi:hypothetical protein
MVVFEELWNLLSNREAVLQNDFQPRAVKRRCLPVKAALLPHDQPYDMPCWEISQSGSIINQMLVSQLGLVKYGI